MRYIFVVVVLFISIAVCSQPSMSATEKKSITAITKATIDKEAITQTTASYPMQQLQGTLQKLENDIEILTRENNALKRKLLTTQLNDYFKQQRSNIPQHQPKQTAISQTTFVLNEHDYLFDH